MARKFLYIVAVGVVLVFAVLFALRMWSTELTRLALTPSIPFEEQDPLADNAYADPGMWYSRPGMGASDPTRWHPAGLAETRRTARAAVFFVHPTSYLDRAHWNAALNDTGSRDLAAKYVRAMASPFNRSANLWAPRYRQATVGTFFSDSPDASEALDAAYGDVLAAFDFFVATIDKDAPLILAGHSQGAYHLVRLVKDRIAGSALVDRVIAVYAIGWPVSTRKDLPEMGLPACATAEQQGCVLSWQSFAEPADPQPVLDVYASGMGPVKMGFAPGDVLCTNPLTGANGGRAEPQANLGTLVPGDDFTGSNLIAGAVPARCDPRGILLIGDAPNLGNGVLPGNNYHIYDFPLFWSNVRADAARREAAWLAAPGRVPASAGDLPTAR